MERFKELWDALGEQVQGMFAQHEDYIAYLAKENEKLRTKNRHLAEALRSAATELEKDQL